MVGTTISHYKDEVVGLLDKTGAKNSTSDRRV